MRFYETFDSPYDYQFHLDDEDFLYAKFYTMDRREVEVRSSPSSMNPYKSYLEFEVDTEQKVTGGGDAFRIMATIVTIVKEYMDKATSIKSIQFSTNPSDTSDSRFKLYHRLVKRLSKGYDVKIYGHSPVHFLVSRR